MSALAAQPTTPPQVQAAHPAGVAVMSPAEIKAKLDAADLPVYTAEEKAADEQELVLGMKAGDVKEMGATFLDGGVPVPFAAAAGMVASLFTRDYFSKREMAKLTDTYRDLIAQKLQMNPEAVTEAHLKICAQQDEGLASAILAVANRRETHVVTNASGLGGMAAGAAVGAIAGAAALWFMAPVGALIGSLAGGMLGYEGGEQLGKHLLDVTDQSDPHALLEALIAKKEAKEYITTEEVFALKLAQHPKLRERVVERHGANFANLDDAARKEVMHALKPLAQQAARDAIMCNFPEADIRALMFGSLAPQAANLNGGANGKWVQRVAPQAQKPQQVGFAEAVMRGREAFAKPQQLGA